MKNYRNIKNESDFEAMFNKMNLEEIKAEYFDLIKHFNILNAEGSARIFLTQADFDRHFVVRNPSEENRGRKKTIITEEDKQKQIERRREYQRQRYHQLKGTKE